MYGAPQVVHIADNHTDYTLDFTESHNHICFSCFQFYVAYDESKYVELVSTDTPVNISAYNNDSKPLLTVTHGKGKYLF